MDAKPQRPLRINRAPGDENIAPSNKTLHQRHKSTGTLSNMLGIKAAAKRTILGDASNTVKNMPAAHDDSAIPGKPSDTVKPLQLSDKSAGFLRPAQRPLGAAATKGPLVNSQNSTHTEPTSNLPKAPLRNSAQVQSQPLAPHANKRTLSKKGTTIYKDTVETEQPQALLRPEAAPTAPVHQSLAPRQHKSEPQLNADQPALRRTQSRLLGNEHQGSDIPKEEVYQDAAEHQAPESYEGYMSMDQQQEKSVQEVSKETQNAVERLQRQLPLGHSDPVEVWDKEEEEEMYDEEGYTTAHSTRSRGENTTGGATTVMFPHVTNRVKKEIAAATELVESSRTAEEIEDEAWDTSMVAEYGEEIFSYMRELESKMLPNPHYMSNQTEIQWSMRAVLMDWLVQVHHRFSLLPETLFLCVNYIDRFLTRKIVSLGKLQLVGATAIFVAAKYEEINCPSVSEIVYMVDGGYTVDEILKAERFMLSMLEFELGWPGPMSFLRRISKADDYDLETRTLAKYFLEVTIMDERFVGSPPSYTAAGAHCLARLMLKKGDWSPAHVYYSGYTWTQLRALVSMIMDCCEAPQKHHGAVYEKYADRKYKRAAIFVQSELRMGFSLPLLTSRPSLPPFDDVAAQLQYETGESFKRMVQVKG